MSGPGLHVFILIDALGWFAVEEHDFLRYELPYRRPLRTVLGFSSGAIPTILTGSPPSQNGHWNLFYYDPQNSPFRWLKPFRLVPRRAMGSRVARKIIKELGRRVLGLGPLFECCVHPHLLPWFNWVEKRSIYAPGGISGCPSIFDRLEQEQIPYLVYSYHQLPDAKILRRAHEDISAGRARFFFLYLSELDNFLHFHCQQGLLVREKLGWYQAQIKKLLSAAISVDRTARLTVFSDHGMTPIRRRFDLVRRIESLSFRMPEDYLAVYDSTMARFWFFSEEAKVAICACLQGLSCGRVLTDDQLCRFGALFPDHRFGEVIFLLNPGVLLSRSDFNGRDWSPRGMHGYHPEDPFSDAVFLGACPPESEPHHIGDIYAVLEAASKDLAP